MDSLVTVNLILLAVDSASHGVSFMASLKNSCLRNPVYLVRSAAEAIRYLDGKKPFADRKIFPLPSILVVDLDLPRKKAWRLLKWVRARAKLDPLLIVMLNGSSPVSDLNRAYQMGANSFLEKPCLAEDLVRLAAVFPHYWDESSN
jgi:CheY-like chemotaxis protein